jgi:hypothetical protein
MPINSLIRAVGIEGLTSVRYLLPIAPDVFQRADEPEQATPMEADKALERIGHDPGEYREQGPDHGK